jgi:hypothetical protein
VVRKGVFHKEERGVVLVRTEDHRVLVSLKATLQNAGLSEKVVGAFCTRLTHRSIGSNKSYAIHRVRHGFASQLKNHGKNQVRLCASKQEAVSSLGKIGKELRELKVLGNRDYFQLQGVVEAVSLVSVPAGRPLKVVETKQKPSVQLALDFAAEPAQVTAQAHAPVKAPKKYKPRRNDAEKAQDQMTWLHGRYKALAMKAKSLTMTEVATYLRLKPSDLINGLVEEGLIVRGKRDTYKATDLPLARKVFLNPGEINPRVAPAHLEMFEMLQYSWKMLPAW